MKISIGAKVVDGPYGGGNLFVKNLENPSRLKAMKFPEKMADRRQKFIKFLLAIK